MACPAPSAHPQSMTWIHRSMASTVYAFGLCWRLRQLVPVTKPAREPIPLHCVQLQQK